MKKIIIGVLALVFLFVGQSAFANVTWNTDPTDCPGSGIGIDGGAGVPAPGSNDCWNLTSVSGNPGDSVNVQLYYHNTGNQPATNTRVYIHVSPSLGTSSTTHTFTSSLSASPSGTSLGTTTLHLSSPQALSMGPNDTWWYPNQTTSNPIKSGTQITTSSGLYLGTINNGWSSQGTVVAAFKIGSTQPQNCSIDSFTANPQTINQGNSSTLSWNTTGCTNVKLNNNTVSLDGSQSVAPANTTTYTLKGYLSNGALADTKTVTVNVNPNTPPTNCTINSFTASPASVNTGGYSTLSWNTTGCDHVYINPSVGSNLPVDGSVTVGPLSSNTTYVLTASYFINPNVQTSSVTIHVSQPSQTTGDISSNSPSCVIASGGNSCLMGFHWSTQNPIGTSSVTNNGLTLAVGNNGNQSFDVDYGTQNFYLYNHSVELDHTTVTASCATGTSWNGSKCTPTIVSACKINSFTAIPTIITKGQSSNLNWSTSNCNSVKITSGILINSTNYPLNGNLSVSPTLTTTYILTAYGANGVTQTKTATVIVKNAITPVCTINKFSASSTSITSGQSSTLNWSTTNCTSVSLNGTEVPTISTKIVRPTQTTTYILTAYGANGVPQTRSITIYVNTIVIDNCSIDNFSANPTSITQGDPSILTWKTTNCLTTKLEGNSVSATGSKTVWPTETTTYTLTARGVNGSTQTRDVTIYVDIYNPNNNCTIDKFSASPTSIDSGDSSTLTWDTSNCTNIIITNLGYGIPLSGSQEVWPTHTTTYTLSVHGVNGGSQTQSVTVYVNTANPNYCSINNFSASPTSITKGDDSKLSWNTTDCASVKLNGVEVSPISNKTVWPTHTTTYTLTARAYGSNSETVSEYVTIYVDQNDYNSCEILNFEASDTSISDGDYSILSWDTNNCDSVKITTLGNVDDNGSEKVYPTSDKTYTLTAYDSDGGAQTSVVRIYVDDNNNNSDCSIDSFTASDTYIDSGDAVTLRWRTSGCDDVRISNIGDVDDDGSERVYPDEDITYTLRAYGDGGSDSESIRINVDDNNNNNGYYYPNYYNTNVVTTVATNITQTSAQVNGLITNSNYNSSNTYFEYGTDINLGLRTSYNTTRGNTNFSEYLTGLSPNTIYYFRAVAENSKGVSRGAIEVFKTLGYVNNYNDNTTVRTVRQVIYQQGPTISGSESPIVLQIENRYQTIGVGDTIDYTVFYKNISSSTLTHPMVQVIVPQGITLINSSRGTYSPDNKTLSVPIDDLSPDEEGVIYLQARVDSLDSNLAQVVTTAILIYTNPNGAQENAMAYVLNNPRINGSLLGASAFFGRIFGMSLLGWLFLIVLILLAVLISRSYYGRRNTTTTTTVHHQ